MRIIRLALVIVALCLTTVYADSMDARGTASGNVILYFSGTSGTGTFDSTFALTGNLILDDVAVAFTASGWARGAGGGDTVTLDLDAQATFAATGSTETGEHISVQGGITLAGLTAGASGSSGSGTGTFLATVFLGDRVYQVQGAADGSATGGFVLPEDPYSMELSGTGLFHLSGEMTLISPADATDEALPDDPASEEDAVQLPDSILESVPWDTSTWPEELLAELLEILTRVVDIPVMDEASPATD